MTKPEAKPPAATREPDYAGTWRVWIIPMPEELEVPDHAATLGAWLIDAPGPHAFWRCWRVGLIHLRDIPGVRPAALQRPGMTHEVISEAIDPSTAPSPETAKLATMRPIDFAVQFKAPNDDIARRTFKLPCARSLQATCTPTQTTARRGRRRFSRQRTASLRATTQRHDQARPANR